MTYVLPKQIALKHNVSLKTIYNYISKYSDKIRISKQYWKTYIFEPDFEKYYSKDFQEIQNIPLWEENTQWLKEFWTLKKDFEVLQNNFTTLSEEKNNTDKYNLALQDQLSKYGLLLIDERAEKKELLQKYENLQQQFNDSIVNFSKEKIKQAKAFYLLLWIVIVFIVLAIILFWKPLINSVFH